MKVVGLELKNWRNFKSAEMQFETSVVYFLGVNASGKSNLIDSLRFLRDISKPIGGGLQTALNERGGFSKVRCLHSHGKKSGGGTDLVVKVRLSDGNDEWLYDLAVNYPREGRRDYPRVVHERVTRNGVSLLDRPLDAEKDDSEQLRVTFLEQAAQNASFRKLSEFFSSITYVHIVPQLVKFGERISGNLLPEDPFGQAFMKRIADTAKKTRDARLTKISKILEGIVPGIDGLAFDLGNDGRPHIEMRYRTFRPRSTKQLEDQLSDGTLRLIALLWLLQEKRETPLLLEEPELSLNEEIVRRLHAIFQRVSSRSAFQLFVTTHSYALLSNPGIDPRSVYIVKPRQEGGSEVVPPTPAERAALSSGVPPADVLLPRINQLEFEI